MKGTEKSAQILLPNEIGRYVKFLVGIVIPFRAHATNFTDPTIKPTIVHYNQVTVPVHSNRDYFPLKSLDIGTYVCKYRRNIDNCTEMNPQVPIMTTIQKSNISSNYDIFYFVSRTSDITYGGFLWHGAVKSESENIGGNKIFETAERKNNFEVKTCEFPTALICRIFGTVAPLGICYREIYVVSSLKYICRLWHPLP